jgi:hypothetical protein
MEADVRGRTRPFASAAATAMALAGWLCFAAPLAAQQIDPHVSGPYAGKRVVEVLAQLQAAGARIIFSRALVPETLVVKTEPKGRTVRQVATEILAEHGLGLQEGPKSTWLVVRNGAARPVAPGAPAVTARETPSPAGKRAGDATGETQSLLRIEEQVDVTEKLGEFAGQPSVKTISTSAVRETAGGLENVLQVLPLLPGIAATDDEEGKLAVRGAGPQHNVILFDGVQVHSPQRFGDFTTSFINPAVAANVALDASGLDARHGGRLSSVLVLETRDGRTDRRFAFSGSAGLTNGDLLLEGRLPGTTSGSWWAATRGTYYRFVTDRLKEGTRPSFWDVQFKVSVKPTAHTRLSLVGLAGNESEIHPMLSDGTPFIKGDVQHEFDADNRLAAAHLSWTPNRRVTTITTVTAYSNASRYQDHWLTAGSSAAANANGVLIEYNASGPAGPFDRRIRIQDVALRQRAMVVWSPGHVLDTGVEVRRLRNSWFMSGGVFAPHGGGVGPNTWGEQIAYEAGPIDVGMNRTQVGTWFQERIPIGGGLEVEPGLRLDWNSLTRERAVQPRVRVTKSLGETVIWGGTAWQAQTPGHETMQQGFQFFDFTSPEAGTLRNERSRQIVFGLERPMAGGMRLRVEAFRRRFDRLLLQRLETDAERLHRLSEFEIPLDLPPDSAILEHWPTVHPQSIGTGRATGVELLVQRDRGRVTGWISYTLSRAEREVYGRTVPFDFDRRHALSAVAHVDIWNVRVSATQQFGSGFPTTSHHSEVEFVRRRLPDGSWDPLFRTRRHSDGTFFRNPFGYPFRTALMNDTRMSAYARTDVRVSWSIGRQWEFYGEIINLFNRENFTQPAIYDSGSSFDPVVGRRPRYQSLPRLPTYGVRVRF